MISRGKWGSKVGFILAAAGSAIGLGNIWRFPYITGNNGGALFVLIYIVAIIVLGLPIMLAEFALGRATAKNPVGAFNAIRPGTKWHFTGFLGVITGVMILTFYSVIAGWTLGYCLKCLGGQFKGIVREKAALVFQSFISDSWVQILWLAVFLLLTIYIVSKGISGGLEKYAKVMMPLLFVIMLLLLIRSLTLPGAEKGLLFYLKPDFSKINGRVFLAAMGQAFFSLSLGMGTMLTYGSYLKRKENLVSSAAWVAALDSLIAILAGFIIFPALFSQNMMPDQGPGLVFVILPVIFSQMPGGVWFGFAFFTLLAVAALTSTISLLEVPVSFLIDEKKWPRRKATWLVGMVAFVLAVPSALSGGGVRFFTNLPILHKDFLSLWDKLWGNIALSIGAFLVAIFVGYVWKTANALDEITNNGVKFRLAKCWVLSIKYVCPLLILIVLISQFF